MSLLRREDDETGIVARVAEVLHDDPCLQGRASRVLLMNYPTNEGRELELPVPALGPTIQARNHSEGKSQTKKGDRMLFTSIHAGII